MLLKGLILALSASLVKSACESEGCSLEPPDLKGKLASDPANLPFHVNYMKCIRNGQCENIDGVYMQGVLAMPMEADCPTAIGLIGKAACTQDITEALLDNAMMAAMKDGFDLPALKGFQTGDVCCDQCALEPYEYEELPEPEVAGPPPVDCTGMDIEAPPAADADPEVVSRFIKCLRQDKCVDIHTDLLSGMLTIGGVSCQMSMSMMGGKDACGKDLKETIMSSSLAGMVPEAADMSHMSGVFSEELCCAFCESGPRPSGGGPKGPTAVCPAEIPSGDGTDAEVAAANRNYIECLRIDQCVDVDAGVLGGWLTMTSVSCSMTLGMTGVEVCPGNLEAEIKASTLAGMVPAAADWTHLGEYNTEDFCCATCASGMKWNTKEPIPEEDCGPRGPPPTPPPPPTRPPAPFPAPQRAGFQNAVWPKDEALDGVSSSWKLEASGFIALLALFMHNLH